MKSEDYLTNIPQELEKYGFCKTMIVRRDLIHIKHIFTEIFQRKTLDHYLKDLLTYLQLDMFDYMEIMTRIIRKTFLYSREYKHEINSITKEKRNSFFKDIELRKGLNNIITLDFDGTVTSNKFTELYKLCCEREITYIVTANPTVENKWFLDRNLPSPNKIYACKGKVAKIRCLIDLNKRFDQVFYVDNEITYLKAAWIFGIKTFLYENGKIKYFTLKTK